MSAAVDRRAWRKKNRRYACIVSIASVLIFALTALAQDDLPDKFETAGRLGVFHHAQSPAELKAFGLSSPAAIVTGVFPGSAAERAGIQPGDVITEFEGQKVKNYSDVVEMLSGKSAGGTVSMVYSRRSKSSRLTLRLTKPDSNINIETFRLAKAGKPWAQFAIGECYRTGRGTKRDPEKARIWLGRATHAGISAAQWALATMYETGDGDEPDLKQALALYEKVALQEVAKAQYKVGTMYASAMGCTKNERVAVAWYDKAARQNHADAQYALGEMFQNGRGIAKNEGRALDLFRKAAGGGNVEAMATMGNFYASGDRGVGLDYQTAIRWLTPAAKAGLARAQHDLGTLYYYGHGVGRDHATAAQWMHAAAVQGYVPSQAVLGSMYLAAEPPDYPKALQWLTKAAEHGNPQSLNALGQMYRNGWSVPKDLRKAFDYQLRAAQAGSLVAQYNVGVSYIEGTVIPQNHAEAMKWLQPLAAEASAIDKETKAKVHFAIATVYHKGGNKVPANRSLAIASYEKAAQAGHVESQRVFGQLLRDQKNYVQSVVWLRKAAEKGDRAAQNDLGTAYAMGQGVPKNRRNAIAWLLRAHQQGSPTAKESLRKLGIKTK